MATIGVVAISVALSTIGYVVVVYVIQGKPTQRQRDRSSIKQLQTQVNQLDTRVRILEAK